MDRRRQPLHGWFMRSDLQVRFGLLVATGLTTMGCTSRPNAAAPQAPATSVPLVAAMTEFPAAKIAQTSANRQEARIVGVAPNGAHVAASAIREPILLWQRASNGSATPTPVRHEQVALHLPAPAAPPHGAVIPDLPVKAAFTTPVAAPEGPQLSAPGSADEEPQQPISNRQVFTPPNVPAAQGSATIVPPGWSPPSAAPSSAAPSSAAPYSAAPLAAARTAAPTPASMNATVAMANAAALQPIAQRAMQMAENASAIAQRGMFYSARSELLQALQLIAQALDMQEGTTVHAAALSSAMTALAEARDFSTANNRASDAVTVSSMAANHRTPLFRDLAGAPSSPIAAQQQYFAFAQSQLGLAVGGVNAASPILYRLGRLQTAMAAHDADPLALHGPESMVYHQAALAIDSGNWLAANELGVLYARYGQLAIARQLLVYSVSTHPHAEGWHNLAVVHRNLGENDLAARAETERKILVQSAPAGANPTNSPVRLVDAKTFAAAGGPDTQWSPTVAARPSTNPSTAPASVRR